MPVTDFVELTATLAAWSPSASSMASTSGGSPAGVDVACASM